jgi:hypothetical protein
MSNVRVAFEEYDGELTQDGKPKGYKLVSTHMVSDAMQSVEDAQLEQLSCIAPAKRKGRQTSDVWQLFSTDESP